MVEAVTPNSDRRGGAARHGNDDDDRRPMSSETIAQGRQGAGALCDKNQKLYDPSRWWWLVVGGCSFGLLANGILTQPQPRVAMTTVCLSSVSVFGFMTPMFSSRLAAAGLIDDHWRHGEVAAIVQAGVFGGIDSDVASSSSSPSPGPSALAARRERSSIGRQGRQGRQTGNDGGHGVLHFRL